MPRKKQIKKPKIIKERKKGNCAHCWKEIKAQIIYYINRKYVLDAEMKKRLVKKTIWIKSFPRFCVNCKLIPICQTCEIIMCKQKNHLGRQSPKDPLICTFCQERIDFFNP